MDLSGWLGIAFFILSVPVGIATNLLTPRFQAWWGTTTAKRRKRRIEKIEGSLSKLTVELEKLQGTLPPIPSEITPSVIKGPKHPAIEHTGFSTVGFGSEAAQMGFDVPVGLAFFIRNSEQRFETRAHELKAIVSLRSVDGKEIRIEPSPWFRNTARVPGEGFYKQTVTLGMLETAGVLVAIRDRQDFYTTKHDGGMSPKEGQPIPYGEWSVQIVIEGDNVFQEYHGTLSLLPNGVHRFSLK